MVEDTALPPRTPSRSWARIDVLVLCAVVAACSTALAAFSWSRGTTAAAAIEYRQTAGLSYAAPSGAPTIYGRTGLVTGDPVYLKAVSALRVTYAYSIAASGAPEGFTGAEQLVATVSNGLGLARDVPLEPVQHFAGSAFRTTATLDLATLEAVAATFDSFLGTSGASYTVSLSPHVVVRGRLGAVPLKAIFDEPTKFTMTPSELVTAGTTGASRSVALGKPVVTGSSGSVPLPAGRPATLFLGFTVSAARILSLVLLAASLAAGALLGLPLLREAISDDERVRIATRHGSTLVEVDALPDSGGLAVVDLSSFEGLVHVARRLECPILHRRAHAADDYAVVDNGTLYRYRLADAAPQAVGRVVPGGSATARHAAPGASDEPAREGQAASAYAMTS